MVLLIGFYPLSSLTRPASWGGGGGGGGGGGVSDSGTFPACSPEGPLYSWKWSLAKLCEPLSELVLLLPVAVIFVPAAIPNIRLHNYCLARIISAFSCQ